MNVERGLHESYDYYADCAIRQRNQCKSEKSGERERGGREGPTTLIESQCRINIVVLSIASGHIIEDARYICL